MRDFKCKKAPIAKYVESLIRDACHKNRNRFSYYTPEYTVTFDFLGNGEYRAIVTDENLKVAASAIVDGSDI